MEVENTEGDDDESIYEAYQNCSEESIENLNEIEARLYSVIHYNDLTKPLDKSLMSNYNIEVNERNEIIVSLKEVQELEQTHELQADSDKTAPIVQVEQTILTHSVETRVEETDLNSKEQNTPSSLSSTCANNESNTKQIVECMSDVVIASIDAKTRKKLARKERRQRRKLRAQDRSSSTNDNLNTYFQGLIKTLHCSNNKQPNCSGIRHDPANKSKDTILCDGESNNDKPNIVINILSDDDDEDCKIVRVEKAVADVVCTESVNAKSSVHKSEVSNKKSKPSKKARKRSAKKEKLKTKIIQKYKNLLCPKKWSTSMVTFYNKTSERQTQFDHKALIREMKEKRSSPSDWYLSPKDTIRPKKKGNKKLRCLNCRQYGHLKNACPDPVRRIICYMCGVEGHREPKCPRKQCLSCGRPCTRFVKTCPVCMERFVNNYLLCKICGSRFHEEFNCPNMWRAFHMTTEEGPLIVPHSDWNEKQFCCNCAQEGHQFHQCTNSYNSALHKYAVESPVVNDYSQVASTFANLKSESNFQIALRLSNTHHEMLSSADGDVFLQDLCNKHNVILELENSGLTIKGNRMQYFAVCQAVNSFVGSISDNCKSNRSKRKT